jgi:hypothetical protein
LNLKNANCSGSCTGFGNSNLQQVTNVGATTTNEIYALNGVSSTEFIAKIGNANGRLGYGFEPNVGLEEATDTSVVDLGYNATKLAINNNNIYAVNATISPATMTGGSIAFLNNAFNLGYPQSSWHNIYASGTSFLAYVSSTGIYASGYVSSSRLAVGNNADISGNGDDAQTIDFSNTRKTFTGNAFNQFGGVFSVDTFDADGVPNAMVSSSLYGLDQELIIPTTNTSTVNFVDNLYSLSLTQGQGHVGTSYGGLIAAQNKMTTSTDYQAGLDVGSFSENAGGNIAENHGVEVFTGTEGATNATDTSVYVFTPFTGGEMLRHQGIYLEDQRVAVAPEDVDYSILSRGGDVEFDHSALTVQGTSSTFDMSQEPSDFPSIFGYTNAAGMRLLGPNITTSGGGGVSKIATLAIDSLPTAQAGGTVSNYIGLRNSSPPIRITDDVNGSVLNEWIEPTGATSSITEFPEMTGLLVANDVNDDVNSSTVVGPGGLLVDIASGIHIGQIEYSARDASSSNPVTLGVTASLLIDGPPTGTSNNVVVAEQHAILVQSGDTYLNGTVHLPLLAAPTITDAIVCVDTNGLLRKQLSNCTVSSIRFKEHVQSLSSEKMMEEIRKLRSVEYDYSNGGLSSLGVPHDEGFIAEEVAQVDPYLAVYEATDEKTAAAIEKLYPGVTFKKDGKIYTPRTVDYSKISVLYAGAFQDMDARLMKLEHRTGIIERFIEWVKSLFKK